ncbi:hypothetical protein GCM10025864_02350 [Luteimicrobium album]|uniref:UspA domain-containing protein n=1 Tax=Luteimicrobium album TaxID=1054550 RepID=A0ABQ6HVJ9_9MICO|nr:hypothetical protein GCM10025864_02350 [Luteimicrobium album]
MGRVTVLLAYNLTPQGDAALRVAVDEAQRRGTTLTLLTLSVPGADRSDGVDPEDELAHAREQLPAGLADAPVLRRDPDVLPAEAILDAVDQVSPRSSCWAPASGPTSGRSCSAPPRSACCSTRRSRCSSSRARASPGAQALTTSIVFAHGSSNRKAVPS